MKLIKCLEIWLVHLIQKKVIMNLEKTVNTSNNINYIPSESMGDKSKTLTIKQYLDMIRPYLRDVINDYKTKGEWNIYLTIAISFISSKYSDETRTMHLKVVI